ncbi:MAG: cytochrome c/FTR1 family iron permease [Rubrivivax sp.]
MTKVFFRLFLAVFSAALIALPTISVAAAEATEASVRQMWQLIDYVAVDYGGAVVAGAVKSESEYAEMREFTDNAQQKAALLPKSAGKEAIVNSVTQLQQAVRSRADSAEVARLARQANGLLLAAYPVQVAPSTLPSLGRGAALYETQCASCHGATGLADGPMTARLDPKPIALADRERARSRSLMALYQVITQGVEGTSMSGFSSLPDADRWALAFHAGTLSYNAAMRERGALLWRDRSTSRARFADLTALTTVTEATAAESLGAIAARDLTAYLRSHPEAVSPDTAGGLTLARSRLQQSLSAARSGDLAAARQLGLSAYLDGFEPVEPTLAARNKALKSRVESTMLEYRAALASGQIQQASTVAGRLDGLFMEVEHELNAVAADPVSTYIGALTILLREGVEALLVVVGMLAFLRKAGRPDVVRHVHAGWLLALVAGGATWGVATYVVGISGASREVTEGLSSLFAALVLLGVGLWMHQKSRAGRWQAYLKQKLSSALSRRTAWALFALSFIAVYREVFETVLFYSALAVDGNGAALVAGLASAVAILLVVAWLLLRTSARMPIGTFFAASSILVAILSVVLAGKGIAALQEAGWLGVHPLAFPRIEVLGIFPTAETLAMQLAVLVIAVGGFWLNATAEGRIAAAKAHQG